MSDPCMTRPCRRATCRPLSVRLGSENRAGLSTTECHQAKRYSAVLLPRPYLKWDLFNLAQIPFSSGREMSSPSPRRPFSLLLNFHPSPHNASHFKRSSSHRDRQCINGQVIRTGYSSSLKLQQARRPDGCTRCRHLPCSAYAHNTHHMT